MKVKHLTCDCFVTISCIKEALERLYLVGRWCTIKISYHFNIFCKSDYFQFRKKKCGLHVGN
jgi:hypothetical protein